MSHNIPLYSLRTFIEVSRQGSMKLAAEKMCITTGAVSQQIRHLEEQMGIKLFSRQGKRLMLSIPGFSLRDAVAQGFDEIENAWARIAPPVQNQLVISALCRSLLIGGDYHISTLFSSRIHESAFH
ncbi:LysR family transcriptional regulator [Erwinia rhapontici]|uniref:LysR family transcriptional regulator n=1 Tax=Erwinia rhapontici TaxID=55212 RepID=UPI0013316E48|nr:LysR family transcriptional regulator [Erwinia rhapontici]MBP2156387.1 DNA-binding transcriptional LysR family regulator [Erwinia rhapontici]